RAQGLADDAMRPSDDVALIIEACPHAVEVHRTVLSAANVIFARPDKFDRRAIGHGFSDFDRLDNKVGSEIGATPEAATRQQRMDGDLRSLDAECFCDVALIDGLELTARPYLALAVFNFSYGIKRLHGRMGKERKFKIGSDNLGGLAQGGFGVSVLTS